MQLEGADGFRKEAKERDSLIDSLQNQIEGLNNQIRERDQMLWNLKNQKESL
jgi:peptidoglycan hydrolase CwlO-like protein